MEFNSMEFAFNIYTLIKQGWIFKKYEYVEGTITVTNSTKNVFLLFTTNEDFTQWIQQTLGDA